PPQPPHPPPTGRPSELPRPTTRRPASSRPKSRALSRSRSPPPASPTSRGDSRARARTTARVPHTRWRNGSRLSRSTSVPSKSNAATALTRRGPCSGSKVEASEHRPGEVAQSREHPSDQGWRPHRVGPLAQPGDDHLCHALGSGAHRLLVHARGHLAHDEAG